MAKTLTFNSLLKVNTIMKNIGGYHRQFMELHGSASGKYRQQVNFWLNNWMPDGPSLTDFYTQQTIDMTFTMKNTPTKTGD
jgi:hypothetical protein